MNLKQHIRRILREETEYVKDVRVKISDILKTNRDGQSLDDAIVNVQDGLKSYSEGPPFLLKIGDKYEVLDGFHRIAQKILDGKKYIISDVMIKESNMNLQESIKRIKEIIGIISEKNDKDKNLIWNLIGEFGLKHTIEIFNGFDNFIKKLNTTPKQFMLDYFLDKVYDIKNSGVSVGEYDFKYKVVDIKYNSGHNEYIFYVIITEGKSATMNGETYDLLSNEIPEEILGKIESEIKVILYRIFHNFLDIIGNDKYDVSISLEKLKKSMNLKQYIRRILREETYTSINVRRRIDRLKKLVDVVLSNSHPCDFSNEDHYLEGVIYDLETFLITYQMEGMTNEEIISFVRNYFYDNIKRYYIDSQEDC